MGAVGGPLWSDGERAVVLVDHPAFGRPARLVWHKRRWRCPRRGCGAGTVTEAARAIAPPRALLTSRAARWATRQAGRGRPLKDAAAELGCGWHAVNLAVQRWGRALLDADTERISEVAALGLDEHLMMRRGRFRAKTWGTSIVDVGRGQLLDIVRGRDRQSAHTLAAAPAPRVAQGDPLGGAGASLAPTAPRSTPRCPKPDRSRTPSTSCGWATTPSTKCDAGSRTRRWDTAAAKTTRCTGPASCSSQRRRTSPSTDTPSCGASSTPETPTARSATPGTPKRPCAAVYDIPCAKVGAATVAQLAADLQEPGLPEEINRLGRTIATWRTQISNWHAARVTNAPTEAANNLIKRVKRAAFGFTNFDNYRIRALLYAGKPNWALLDTLTPT